MVRDATRDAFEAAQPQVLAEATRQIGRLLHKSGQIASSPRVEDCVGCKRCETACPTDFLSVRVYLGAETTRSLGLAY